MAGCMNRVRPLLVLLVAAVSLAARAAGAPEEQWYIMMMGDVRAGWMRTTTNEEGGVITSETEFRLALKRGTDEVVVTMLSGFVETPEGKPVSMRSRMNFGTVPVETTYRFLDDGVEMTSDSGQGQKTTVKHPPIQGEWLTPYASEQFVTKRLAAGAQEISFRAVDPMSGLEPTTTTMRSIQRTTAEFGGKTIPAYSMLVENSSQPGMISEVLAAEDGTALRTTVSMGSMTIVQIAATQEEALAELTAPEVMFDTFVTPDRRIRDARELQEATYILRLPGDEIQLPPSIASQRAERLEDGSVRITVNAAGYSAPALGELEDPAFLASTAMLRCDDPEIAKLHARAIKNRKAPDAQRAEALRRMVFQHIRHKDYGVGFASASETARTRQGDCSEHGVLLAALLRADGIPSRVVAGLVYFEPEPGQGVFGYHMWTQALVDVEGEKRWIDLDATLGPTPFDATHIAIVVSALRDTETVSSLSGIAALLGRLQIEVESLEPAVDAR